MDQELNPKKEEMDFLYDEDIIPALGKLGLKEAFLQGKLKCHFCNKIITEDNLSAFFSREKYLEYLATKKTV